MELQLGLFKLLGENAFITGITISGNIKSSWFAGAIAGECLQGARISDCINYANITGHTAVGGISGGCTKVEKCKNYGKITLTGSSWDYGGAGGINGMMSGGENTEYIVNDCTNYGDIQGYYNVGGIVGCSSTGSAILNNCKNTGRINCINQTRASAGGILGWQRYGNLKIVNSYNTGEIVGNYMQGGIIGRASGPSWDTEIITSINNCWSIGSINSSNNASGGIIGGQGTTAAKNYLYINNSWNLGRLEGEPVGQVIGKIETSTSTETKTEFENVYCEGTAIGTGTLTSGEATQKTSSEMKSQSFIDLLNSNIGTNTDWKRWKLGKDGYPTFEE